MKTLYPEGDTFINKASSYSNYSTSSDIYIGKTTTDINSLKRGMIYFNYVSSSVVFASNSTLNLYITDNSGNTGTNIYVFAVKKNADITNATWNAYRSGGSWSVAGAYDSVDIDMTELGHLYVAAGASGWAAIPLNIDRFFVDLPNYGFLLKSDEGDNSVIKFASTEYASGVMKPKLILQTSASAAWSSVISTAYYYNSSGSTPNPFTKNVTVPSLTDGLMIASVATSGSTIPTSVSIGGSSMNLITSYTGESNLYIYSLVNPTTGTYVFSVTCSDPKVTNSKIYFVSNINQSNPFGSILYTTGSFIKNDSENISALSSVGDLVIDFVADNGFYPLEKTLGMLQTESLPRANTYYEPLV